MFQHKVYGVLALAVGCIELLRRLGPMRHSTWAVPLPLFAILGGLMLFGHSHGDHPGAQKIQLHHTVMGLLAVTAGSSKLLSRWSKPASSRRQDRAAGSTPLDPPPLMPATGWELTWAVLILLIGLQLLLYSE
jgi:putative copper resistance protein D